MKQAQEQRRLRLSALLAGERRPEEPEVVQWFAADPSLREEFEALVEVAGAVDLDAARERELMALATEQPDDPAHVSLVARELHRLAGRSPAPGAPTPLPLRRRWGTALLAAAVVVASGYLLWRGRTDPGDDQRILSGAPLTIDAPTPTGDGGLLLSWHATLPGASFEAAVFDPAGGRRAPRLERPEELAAATTWTLPPAAVASLPPGSRLLVVARWSGRSVEQERILR